MEKTNVKVVPSKRAKTNAVRDNLELFLLTLPALVCFAIWHYAPLSGLVLAFKQYNFRDGIFGSKWIGFKNFEVLFKSNSLSLLVRNTVGYAVANILLTMGVAIILALCLFEITKKSTVKFIQTTFILPRFLSMVLVGFVTYALLKSNGGVMNTMLGVFGIPPVDWYNTQGPWIIILPIVNLWKHIGLDMIMYYAALMGVDNSLFEAASLDGASRIQQIRYISIPCIKQIIIILLILALGRIFRGDFGLFYQVPRNSGSLFDVTEIVDTYVYRALESGSYEVGTAVGLVQSIVGLIFVVGSNLIVRKVDPESALF